MTLKQDLEQEKLEATTYTIFRTGDQRQRHYQINKVICGMVIDTYWVQLKGARECYCDCMGFRRQNFPKMEHKHVKIAIDYSARGEPKDAKYTIEGTGHSATVTYLGAKNEVVA